MTQPFNRLLAAAGFVHGADQLVLAAMPVAGLLALGGSSTLVSLLVAVQTSAWLFVSMPAGLWMDRAAKATAIRLALALLLGGLVLASAGAVWRLATPMALGAVLASAGTVVFSLAQIALTPKLAPIGALTTANARIEFLRSLAMCFAPAIVGLAAERVSPVAGLWLALAMAAGAMLLAPALLRVLPPEAPVEGTRPPLATLLRDGAAEVIRQPLLRAIAGCAVFWNLAYVALIAVFFPYAITVLGLSASEAGLALGANGAGMIAGAFFAPMIFARSQPRVILLAGPGLSFAGAALVLAGAFAGGFLPVATGLFLMGMWSMQWLIMQTSIRQIVTPPQMMGRVTATIQTAIYGVRPLGALVGGAAAAAFGLTGAVTVVVALFALSFAVAALSAFTGLKAMPHTA